MKRILVSCLLAVIAGCATTGGTPQRSIYQIKSEYQVALAAAVAYKALPACGAAGAPLVCADPTIVAKLQQADSVAGPAIQAAENAVRDPSFNTSTANAVLVSAEQALLVLTTITAQVGVKK